MASKGSGESFRKGLSLVEIADLFPDEAAATAWFESVVWPQGRCCGKCGSMKTGEVKGGKPMPY